MGATNERADGERTGARAGGSTATDRGGVVVGGEEPVTLPATRERAGTDFDLVTRTVGFECASGDWLESAWTGVALDPLLDDVAFPPATTHVLLVAADGYRACVPVTALFDGMVAYAATDRPATDFPRFVSPSVGGPRAVKDLARIEPAVLAPTEDPEECEDLQLGTS